MNDRVPLFYQIKLQKEYSEQVLYTLNQWLNTFECVSENEQPSTTNSFYILVLLDAQTLRLAVPNRQIKEAFAANFKLGSNNLCAILAILQSNFVP